MAAFAVGSISMIGLPPLAGFVSKWFILSGAMQAADWIAVGALTASTLLNAAYFLPIVYRAWLVPAGNAHGEDGHPAHGEAPLAMVAAQTFTAAAALAVFFFPGPAIALARSLAGG
jgi:multicomponent Na+:H+ antiporter subunit D